MSDGIIFLGLVAIIILFIVLFYEANYETEKRRMEQELYLKDKEIKETELKMMEARLEYYRSKIEEKPDFVKVADEVLKEATQ